MVRSRISNKSATAVPSGPVARVPMISSLRSETAYATAARNSAPLSLSAAPPARRVSASVAARRAASAAIHEALGRGGVVLLEPIMSLEVVTPDQFLGGIQADLKTFAALGVYGTSVLTAITAQNTVAVTAVHEVPTDVIAAQIDAVATERVTSNQPARAEPCPSHRAMQHHGLLHVIRA